MKKTGEDQPPKHVPTMQDLSNLAGKKTKADQDTAYQDNKGKTKQPPKEKPAKS